MNATKKNRNIVLLKSVDELSGEINYQNFMRKDDFIHIADIVPNAEFEKLDIRFVDEKYENIEGLIYVFVIEDKIFKIGQTIGTLGSRVSSYNCGKTEYRIAGTNSTTNYFVLQSLIKIGKTVKVYGHFASKQEYKIWDEEGEDCFPSVKVIEKKLIRDFSAKYHKKPIGNTQK